jgi:hypothetical protein
MQREPQSLMDGRGRQLVRIVPVGELWAVAWPDIEQSIPVNLTRAREAARLWAEEQYLRKNRRQRALKSLINFSWCASPVAPAEKSEAGYLEAAE